MGKRIPDGRNLAHFRIDLEGIVDACHVKPVAPKAPKQRGRPRKATAMPVMEPPAQMELASAVVAVMKLVGGKPAQAAM